MADRIETRSGWRRRLKRGAAILLVLLLGLGLAAFALQRKAVFPTGLTRAQDPEGAGVAGGEVLWRDIGSGRVEAWFLPGRGVDAQHPGPLVVFAHGNAELIDHWPRRLHHYRQRGISVLLVEYRGYGRSDGSPSEASIVDDYVTFYDRVARRPEVDAKRIIFHGRSLGGGVVGGLAKHRPAAAMILQSTFSSVANLARERWFVPAFLVRDPFDSIATVRSFPGPVLIGHGRDDTLIPVSHAHALTEAASEPTLVLWPGNHNDVPPSWPDYWVDVDRFLAEAGILPQASVTVQLRN